MKETNRNEYQRVYQGKWREKHQVRFIESQLRYWKKKLEIALKEEKEVLKQLQQA